jgi:hypothetical protein
MFQMFVAAATLMQPAAATKTVPAVTSRSVSCKTFKSLLYIHLQLLVSAKQHQ